MPAQATLYAAVCPVTRPIPQEAGLREGARAPAGPCPCSCPGLRFSQRVRDPLLHQICLVLYFKFLPFPTGGYLAQQVSEFWFSPPSLSPSQMSTSSELQGAPFLFVPSATCLSSCSCCFHHLPTSHLVATLGQLPILYLLTYHTCFISPAVTLLHLA